METLTKLFTSDGFMPHGYCYLWNSGLVWLHVVSDALIFFSYLAIAITLVYFVRKRRDLPFRWMFVCFGTFIITCGFTHAMEVWTLWHASYWVSGGVKAVTALASGATAVLLVRLVPSALAISNPALLRAEAENRRLAKAIEQAAEAVLITDTSGTIQYMNPAFTRMTGYSREEVLNQNPRILKSGTQGEEVYRDLWKTIGSGKTWQGEIINRRKDGSLYPERMTITPILDSAGTIVHYVAIKQDISERKRAEKEIANLNRVYAVTSEVNQMIVRTRDADRVLSEACRIAVEYGEFRMAWIGMMDGVDGKLKPVAWHGHEDGYLTTISTIPIEDVGPTGRAAREGKTVYCNDYTSDPSVAPWRDEASKRGYRSSIALPIVVQGKSIGALTLYAGEPFFFNEQELRLLQEVTGDISFALEVVEQEKKRERAEGAMRESENLLRAIVETEPECVKLLKINGELIQMNSAGLMMMEADSLEQVKGHCIFPLISPGQRAEFQRLTEEVFQGKSGHLEFEMTGLKGRRRWLETTEVPLRNEAGQVTAALGITRDVTERKSAQEAMRKLGERLNLSLQSAHMGTWDWNIVDNSVVWDERQLALLGLAPGTFSGTFAEFLALVHADDRARLEQDISRAIEKEGTLDHEFRVVWPDGQTRFIAARSEVHSRKDGRPSHLTGVCWDVTEHKMLEQQFQQSQKMEAVGQLAGGVAHDFNNILTVINGYSEMMLQQREPDAPDYRYLDEIKKAGARAASLTRQLLAFSRRQVLMPQVMDLNKVITNVHSMLKRLIGEDIDLVSRLGKDLGLVKADPGQMEQILLNLAVNGRDAMPRGGKLTIETANVELDQTYVSRHITSKAGLHVMLALSDSGVGMDAETQKRIFEPFFTTKAPGKGTGLGLSTVYGIVKQSEGHIWVYSELGHGTTFKIYLPRIDQPLESSGPASAGGKTQGGMETILLVEDDPSVRSLVRTTLAAKGYKILEATHGAEAIQLAEEHQGVIHLLLSDLVMPGISGRILAEQLAVLRPEMKVIYMSGYTDDAVVRHGGLGPGMAFLQKPFAPDALARKVREALDAGAG